MIKIENFSSLINNYKNIGLKVTNTLAYLMMRKISLAFTCIPSKNRLTSSLINSYLKNPISPENSGQKVTNTPAYLTMNEVKYVLPQKLTNPLA